MTELQSFKGEELIQPANQDFDMVLKIPAGKTMRYLLTGIEKYEYSHDESIEALAWRKKDDGKTFYKLLLLDEENGETYFFEKEPHHSLFRFLIEQAVHVGQYLDIHKEKGQYGTYIIKQIYDKVKEELVPILQEESA